MTAKRIVSRVGSCGDAGQCLSGRISRAEPPRRNTESPSASLEEILPGLDSRDRETRLKHESIYEGGRSPRQNQTWHSEDSAWKAGQIVRILEKNHVAPSTVADIGCGAGEIPASLATRYGPEVTFSASRSLLHASRPVGANSRRLLVAGVGKVKPGAERPRRAESRADAGLKPNWVFESVRVREVHGTCATPRTIEATSVLNHRQGWRRSSRRVGVPTEKAGRPQSTSFGGLHLATKHSIGAWLLVARKSFRSRPRGGSDHGSKESSERQSHEIDGRVSR